MVGVTFQGNESNWCLGKITFENDNTIEYLYDASGTKLRKIVTDNTTSPTTVTTTHYIDGFQYNGNTMDFFLPIAIGTEGYVKVTHSSGGGIGGGAITYNYVFNYTDHLGNIRLRYAINPVNQWLEILEEDHYYPFGLKHQGYNAENYVFASFGDGPVQLIPTNPNLLETYKYKFQGQEHQDEFGLNWDSFKWRNSSPDLGRFWVIDPLAEKYVHNSPYAFSENRVIDAVELEGLEAVQTKDLERNRTDVEVRFKTSNSTSQYPLTNEDINAGVRNTITQSEKAYSGKDTQGMDVVFEFIHDPNATITIDYVDFVTNTSINDNFEMQIMNHFAPEFVNEESRGNTESGTIQVSSANSTFQGTPTDEKPGAGYVTTHGFGHIFGLPDNNPAVPGNQMNSPGNSKEDRNISPEQRDMILKNIPDKKN